MTIEIIKREYHAKGVVYTVRISGKAIQVLYLSHAIERIKKWGITEEMVMETLLQPEEVFIGHRKRYIAHRRYGDHLVRAVYEYEDKLPVLTTVYFPYVDRYFKGGGLYEDQIFKGG